MSEAIPACPKCGNADEMAGVLIRGIYDGVLFWECMVHGTRFHRWPEGHDLRAMAEDYLRDVSTGR